MHTSAGDTSTPPSRNWTTEEDILLMNLVSQYGTKWKMIQKELPIRTTQAMRVRWSRLKDIAKASKNKKRKESFEGSRKEIQPLKNIKVKKKTQEPEKTEFEPYIIIIIDDLDESELESVAIEQVNKKKCSLENYNKIFFNVSFVFYLVMYYIKYVN